MEIHKCAKEKEWGALEQKLKAFCKHLEAGDGPGGFRDRLILVEVELEALKKSIWVACIVSGIIGGLIGELSPNLINLIIKLIGLR